MYVLRRTMLVWMIANVQESAYIHQHSHTENLKIQSYRSGYEFWSVLMRDARLNTMVENDRLMMMDKWMDG